jgi:acyl dehydratase
VTVRVGDPLPEWTVETVDPGRMRVMAALLDDPNPIHLDPAAVRALGLGDRVVNQGPIGVGYVQNMLLTWVGGAGRVRALSLRFLARVLAHDRVVAGGEVAGIGTDGSVGCAVWLDVVGRRGGTGLPVRALRGTATVVMAPAAGSG